MRIVIQRVGRAEVRAPGGRSAGIGRGLLCLFGAAKEDDAEDAAFLGKKTLNLRIFEDGSGKMNLNIMQTRGEILSIPQFTLLGSLQKGNRPSYDAAAGPEKAFELWEIYNEELSVEGVPPGKGFFGERMEVSLVNEGPVTIILDSKNK